MSTFKIKFPGPTPTAEARLNIQSRRLAAVPNTAKALWAVGGGKGGVGKTLMTSNIAVYLSWLGKKVVVVDMDLGGANLHTALGVDVPPRTLADVLSGDAESLDGIIQPTEIKNLSLISAAQDPAEIVGLKSIQKAKLLRKLKEIDADFVLLDLGAGTAPNTLDFFLMADRKIVVVTPEPTSIENAYRFIKLAFYRTLRASTPSPYVRELIEQAIDLKTANAINSPKELVEQVKKLSPEEGAQLQKQIKLFTLSLIVNQVRIKSEEDIGRSMVMVCERYFGMTVEYLGCIAYDNSVWQSVRKRIPFLIADPNSTAVTQLEAILRALLRTP